MRGRFFIHDKPRGIGRGSERRADHRGTAVRLLGSILRNTEGTTWMITLSPMPAGQTHAVIELISGTHKI